MAPAENETHSMTTGDARRAKLLAEAERYNFELAMAKDYAAAHGFPEPRSLTWDYLTMGCEHLTMGCEHHFRGTLSGPCYEERGTICGWPPVGELGGQRRCGKHMASGRHV